MAWVSVPSVTSAAGIQGPHSTAAVTAAMMAPTSPNTKPA